MFHLSLFFTIMIIVTKRSEHYTAVFNYFHQVVALNYRMKVLHIDIMFNHAALSWSNIKVYMCVIGVL